MAPLTNTIRIISSLIGGAFRSFAVTLLLVDVIYGLLMATLAFLIAADGSLIRGSLAVIVVLGMVTGFGVVFALQIATVSTIRQAIKQSSIGKLIFDALFDRASVLCKLDSSGEAPQLSTRQIEQTLNKAAKELLNEDLDPSGLPAFFFWLSKQIQRITIWATVRIIVKSCSENSKSVDLLKLRKKLSSVIEEHLLTYLKQLTSRVMFTGLGLITTLTLLVCLGIRQLPI